MYKNIAEVTLGYSAEYQGEMFAMLLFIHSFSTPAVCICESACQLAVQNN